MRFLEPCFLGPQAENMDLLESLLLEFVRDHCYWRRNFHPEDGPMVPPDAASHAEYAAFVARTRRELMQLSAELKRAVPFFSPRYVGHMNADLLLPGLVAKLVTTLYNPNNVSEEAAPVTLEKELEVGRQLAEMFGMQVDEDREPCAWGHLTSGGTTANYEALWNFRSVKFYGVALQAGAQQLGFDTDPIGPLHKRLSEYTKQELVNLPMDDVIGLRTNAVRDMTRSGGKKELYELGNAVRAERLEILGTAGFFLKHRDLAPPKVLVPSSAHYSWEKGMKVLGLGTSQLVEVEVGDDMRLSIDHLRECLTREFAADVPVLAVVGVLGTTEFGAIDPIHRIVAVRDEWRQKGRDFGIHVDAAWGGYMASLFRGPDGTLLPRAAMRRSFRVFPSETVHASFQALGDVDSITVDPHKLGYVPYAAGAFVARNRRVVDFLVQKAAYVFDLGLAKEEVPMAQKLRNLGQYILEGSKSGAAAAAVHVTHKVLPLHADGFGRILAPTVRAAETFELRVADLRRRIGNRVHLTQPFTTDTNVVCLAMNPVGNRSLAELNRFGRRVFAAMRVDATRPVQVKEFIGSYTSLTARTLTARHRQRILTALGIDPELLQVLPDRDDASDHVFLLRHTLMNPWLLDETGADGERGSLLDRYFEYLEQRIDEELVAAG
jgi:glutamate/tyrosine decarboxylase-like PLP-dependent enzyme